MQEADTGIIHLPGGRPKHEPETCSRCKSDFHRIPATRLDMCEYCYVQSEQEHYDLMMMEQHQ